jgi:hypothetical protein
MLGLLLYNRAVLYSTSREFSSTLISLIFPFWDLVSHLRAPLGPLETFINDHVRKTAIKDGCKILNFVLTYSEAWLPTRLSAFPYLKAARIKYLTIVASSVGLNEDFCRQVMMHDGEP